MGQIKNIKLHIVTDIKICNKQTFKMKVFVALCMLVVVTLAEDCCRHGDGVTCVGDKCNLATEEEMAACTEECPLKGCDPITLLQCGSKLFQCGSVCIKQLVPPTQECIECFGGLFQQCFKCLQP